MKTEPQYKIILAVDPLEPEVMPTAKSLSWFREWASQRNALIEVVHVLTASEKNEYELDVQMKHLGLSNAKSTIIVERSKSQRNSVKALVEYSNKKQADLIAVASHGRSEKVGRIVMGSFAENLLATAPVPVLFLKEHTGETPPVNKVLFPTDFSDASKKALDLFLQHIEGYQGEVILFNAVPPQGAISNTVVLGIPVFLPEGYWMNLKTWTDKESEELLKKVQSKGFKAKVAMSVGVLDTPEAIRQCAEQEKVSLIAMASVSTGLDFAVLGSVTREVFRNRKWPVWVCGPEALSKRMQSELTLI